MIKFNTTIDINYAIINSYWVFKFKSIYIIDIYGNYSYLYKQYNVYVMYYILYIKYYVYIMYLLLIIKVSSYIDLN